MPRLTAVAPPTTEKPDLLAKVSPALFLVLWSSGFPVSKLGIRDVPPFTLLSIRFALVLLILVPVALVARPTLPREPRVYLHLAAVGVLLQGGYFGFVYLAVSHGVSAGTVALIVSLQPVVVALVAPHFIGEGVSRASWIGLGLGLLGAVVTIVARDEFGSASRIGVVCAFGALLGMSGGSLYEKRFGTPQHPVTSGIVQYIAGLVLVLPIAVATEPHHVTLTGRFLVAIVYLVLANSILAITLYLRMIRRGLVTQVSALFFLIPPTTALLAWLLLGETVPPLSVVGLGCAVAGVAIVNRDAILRLLSSWRAA